MSIPLIPKFRQKRLTQYKEIAPLFIGYQTDTSLLTQELYFENSSAYPVTAVGSGVVTSQSSNFPLKASKFQTNWTPTSTRPLVGRQSNYSRIVGSASTDGAKIAVNWDITEDYDTDGYIFVVNKSGTTNQAFTATLRTTASNELDFTMAASATTNYWSYETAIKRLTTGTATGTFNKASVTEVEILSNGTIDVAMVGIANNYYCIPGAVLTTDHTCLSEASMEFNQEQANLVCSDLTKEVTPTGRGISFKFQSQDLSLKPFAMFMGEAVKRSKLFLPEILTSANVGAKSAITSAVVTIGANLKIAKIVIDGGEPLTAVWASGDVDANSYHYNTSTGVITFDTSYEGKKPEIQILSENYVNNVAVQGIKTGFVGGMYVTSITDGTTDSWYLPKVQMVSIEMGRGDAADTVTYNYQALPDENGVFGYRVFK